MPVCSPTLLTSSVHQHHQSLWPARCKSVYEDLVSLLLANHRSSYVGRYAKQVFLWRGKKFITVSITQHKMLI